MGRIHQFATSARGLFTEGSFLERTARAQMPGPSSSAWVSYDTDSDSVSWSFPEESIGESLSALLNTYLGQSLGQTEDESSLEPFLDWRCTFAHIQVLLGSMAGLERGAVMPVALGLELACSSVFADDLMPGLAHYRLVSMPKIGSSVVPFAPARWRTEILKRYTSLAGEHLEPLSSRALRIVADPFELRHTVRSVGALLECERKSDPAFVYECFVGGVEACSALGLGAAMAVDSMRLDRSGFATAQELALIGQYCAALASIARLYELKRARLIATAEPSSVRGSLLSLLDIARSERIRVEAMAESSLSYSDDSSVGNETERKDWMQALAYIWKPMEADAFELGLKRNGHLTRRPLAT